MFNTMQQFKTSLTKINSYTFCMKQQDSNIMCFKKIVFVEINFKK